MNIGNVKGTSQLLILKTAYPDFVIKNTTPEANAVIIKAVIMDLLPFALGDLIIRTIDHITHTKTIAAVGNATIL